MELYAALTFWLLVIVMSAWGTHQLWSGLIKPKTVNSILLPGTLVAQLGHMLGVQITGATVNNTSLVKDDDSGEPEITKDAQPRIPVVGPLIIGILPLLACSIAIFFVAKFLGHGLVKPMTTQPLPQDLPTSIAGVWELLRNLITMAENSYNSARAANLSSWHAWSFIYLIVCLTVRMAPFPGTMRGTLGAILLLGIVAAASGTMFPGLTSYIQAGWPILSLSVATLMFLLLATSAIRGIVGMFRLLASKE